MAGDWFLARAGQQTLGPITAQQLKQLGAEGEIQATDLVWRPGMAKWTPAAQVKGLLTDSEEMPSAPPGPVGAQEADWRTAGPPRAPALPSAPPEGDGPALPTAEDEGAFAEYEPWYYGFLERYAKVGLVLGAVVCLLTFVLFVVSGPLWAAAARGGAGLVEALLGVVVGVLALGLALLALALQTAFVLLAVDAARHLRALRRRRDRE
ncbi:MAG TPA: DUF4339 domain-containing protein [Gemmataceae bacterium]|jgi:hypothetical protein|nr:DUF4339 domain-containing protein [Gemmataceae bacterium]